MLRKIKRIAPLQCGIVLGALYGLISLIFVPFILLFVMMAPKFPAASTFQQPAVQQQISAMPQQMPMPAYAPHMGGILAGAGLAMVIIFPVMYAVMGFIGGIIAAFIYNIVAKMVGGIQVEVE